MQFNLDEDRTMPVDGQLDQQRLVDFLVKLNLFGLLDEKNKTGRIVVADHQYANQQSLRNNLKDIGEEERLDMFSNGQEVITHFEKLLKELDLNEDIIVVQPVSLLIIDTDLPGMNGIETI